MLCLMVVGLGTPSILLSTLLVLERLQFFCPFIFLVPWIVIGLTRILTFLRPLDVYLLPPLLPFPVFDASFFRAFCFPPF